MKLRTLLKMVF